MSVYFCYSEMSEQTNQTPSYHTTVVYPTEYKPIEYIQDYLMYDKHKSTFLIANPFWDIPEATTRNIFKALSDRPKTTSKSSLPSTFSKKPPNQPSNGFSGGFNTSFNLNDIGLDIDFSDIYNTSSTSSVHVGGSTAPSYLQSSEPTLNDLQSTTFIKLCAPYLLFNNTTSPAQRSAPTSNFTIAYGLLDKSRKLIKKEYIIRVPFDYESFNKSSVKCTLSPGDIHKIDMYMHILEHQTTYITELLLICLLFQINITTLSNTSFRSERSMQANNEFISTIVSEVNRKLQQISPKLPQISAPMDYIKSFINPPTYKRIKDPSSSTARIIRAASIHDTNHTFQTPLEQLMKSIKQLHYHLDEEVKTLASRLYNANTIYNSTYSITLEEFQHLWIIFYALAEKTTTTHCPSSRLVIYNKTDPITGTQQQNKWFSMPIHFNVNAKNNYKRVTLQHLSADRLSPLTHQSLASMFNIKLDQPDFYNNRKYFDAEGCIYLTPKLHMTFGPSFHPGFNWNVDKFILVKKHATTSRIYNDMDTISELFNDSPKLTSLK